MATTFATRSVPLVGVALLAAAALVVLNEPWGAPDAADSTVVMTMEDYTFSPTELRIPTGRPVTLVFENRDEVTHHVSFGRTLTEEGNRVVGFAEDLFADLDVRVTPASALIDPAPPYRGATVTVPGDQRVTLEVTVPDARAGTWQIGCFTGRGCHYRAGLAATLEVG